MKHNIFSKFCTSREIITNGGSHFLNELFKVSLEKYGVLHRVATPYHPYSCFQVEVSCSEIKQILLKTMNSKKHDRSRRHDDALLDYRTAFNTLIGISP